MTPSSISAYKPWGVFTVSLEGALVRRYLFINGVSRRRAVEAPLMLFGAAAS